MLSAIESVSQARLPGMSSVTTRLRNYSFHAWWLMVYKREIRDTSPAALRQHMRLGQRIYALAAAYVGGDIGVEGSDRAMQKLLGSEDSFDVAEDSEQTAGAFGNIYRNPMVQIGLVAEGEHGLFVPTSTGEQLADAYAASIGEAAVTAFRSAASTGRVTREGLPELGNLAPSRLAVGGGEAALLRRLFLGKRDTLEPLLDRRADVKATLRSAAERRATLRAIVEAAAAQPPGPVSSEFLRWHWLETPPEGVEGEARRKWQAFQSGDLLRNAYEIILVKAQRRLEQDGDLPMPALLELLTETIPDKAFGLWLDQLADPGTTSIRDARRKADQEDSYLEDVLAMLAWLRAFWRDRRAELADAYTSRSQTILTELDWIEERAALPAQQAVQDLVRTRVLLRVRLKINTFDFKLLR